MLEIKSHKWPLLSELSRGQFRVLMASGLGYYVRNDWTDWADRHLLKSQKVMEFIRPTDYMYWLGWFHNLIISENDDEKPLRRHVPKVVEEIGMKPLWAMSFMEKGISKMPAKAPWSPKFFGTENPSQFNEALNLMGLDSGSSRSFLRVERECFPDMSYSPDNLKPAFVERLFYGRENLQLFSVITFESSLGGWSLRCGNQKDLTEKWHNDFSLKLSELDGENLYVGDNFARSADRLLRLQRPFIVEVNDPEAIRIYKYSTSKHD